MASGQVVRASGGDDRREEIVGIAALLFQQEGYHQTSMGRLAAAAGIAKPTLYHYFSGKDEILHEIHRAFIVPLIERHEHRLAQGLPPDELLLEVMVDILELMETHAGHVRVFFEHHRELAPEHRREVVAQRDRYQRMIGDVVVRGTDGGQFRRDVDPDITTLALFGMCNWAYQWYRPTGAMKPRDIAAEMWKLFSVGLLARPAG